MKPAGKLDDVATWALGFSTSEPEKRTIGPHRDRSTTVIESGKATWVQFGFSTTEPEKRTIGPQVEHVDGLNLRAFQRQKRRSSAPKGSEGRTAARSAGRRARAEGRTAAKTQVEELTARGSVQRARAEGRTTAKSAGRKARADSKECRSSAS